MWLFQSRIFMWVVLLFSACLTEPTYAKHKKRESERLSDEIACGEEKVYGTNNNIYFWKEKLWNDDTLYSASEGSFCLNDQTNEFFIRKCNSMTGEWSPPASSVRCANVQKQHNKFCPEDLIEISVRDEFICLKLSDADGIYNESFCYGSDTLLSEKSLKTEEITTILQYLDKQRGIKRFWLPVRRALYNKYFNPFVVRLPGTKWGDLFDVQDLFADNNCMSAEIVDLDNDQLSFQSNISNCTDKLPMVCIFSKEFVAYSGCPQGFGALAHKPNECYGIEWEAGLFPYDLRSLSIAEYVSKTNSLQLIFNSIDLNRDRFFLIGNFSDRNKKNYSIEMNSNEEIRIVPFKGRRHALSCEHFTNLNRRNVEMILKANPQSDGLTLTIYNRNYIWRFSDVDNYGVKCFTNSDSESIQWKAVKIKMLWQNALETKALFELKPGKHDGYYWCEAHTIFDFSIVKTKKIAVSQQKKGHTYALLLELPCPAKECYTIFSADAWKRWSNNAKKIVGDIKKESKKREKFEDLQISDVRLMDISSIYSNGTLEGLIHVSAYLKSFPVNEESEQSSEESNSKEAQFGIVTTVQMKVLNLLTELISPFNSHHTTTIRSTSFCFPETFFMNDKEQNFWQLSIYGQISTANKICLHETGLPVMRLCLGDFLWGAFWEKLDFMEKALPCSQPKQSDIITYQLRDIEETKLPKKMPSTAVEKVRHLLKRNLEKIIPADIYYISRIMHGTMESILKDTNSNLSASGDFSLELARVYNYLMEVNVGVVKFSAMLNSTNILLEAFERMIDKESIYPEISQRNTLNTTSTVHESNLPKKLDSVNILQYEDIGVEMKVANNFVIFILDPYVANVTGVALFRYEDSDKSEEKNSQEVLQGSFKNEFYRFLKSDQSVDDLLYEANLELATYIPKTLWNRLDEISRLANLTSENIPLTRFVIKIYASDLLFQEQDIAEGSEEEIEKTVTGKVVSVSIPGHDKDLPEMLPLIFKIPINNTDNNTESFCRYWNYDTWANDGLTFLARSDADNGLILCGCTHLTPFACLIGDNFKLSVDSDVIVLVKNHEKALDIITILGSSLSLFGTSGIFITAVMFQSWRQKASSKVLLQLSGAISLQMVVFCFANIEENSLHHIKYGVFSSCIAIGALLHYSVLVQFSWMIIIGYLQFKRYVQVFGNTRPKKFFKKSSIIGWGGPLVPVALVLIFDRESYVPDPDDINTQTICYPKGFSLYFAVIFPITVIIFANCIIFSVIVYNILRGPGGNLRHTEKRLALSQFRLSALLFFLLGFTWIFGLLATLRAGITFSYLFCLTATLQGFVIFIYFVILDPKTRRMWRGIFISICGLEESYESSVSLKETIQTLQ